MPHLSQIQARKIASHRRVAASNLKCCPLCGAVNARLNGECFVCRWHGDFDHDAVRIEQGVLELIERCPELANAILAAPVVKPTPLAGLRQAMLRVFRRRIDLAV